MKGRILTSLLGSLVAVAALTQRHGKRRYLSGEGFPMDLKQVEERDREYERRAHTAIPRAEAKRVRRRLRNLGLVTRGGVLSMQEG